MIKSLIKISLKSILMPKNNPPHQPTLVDFHITMIDKSNYNVLIKPYGDKPELKVNYPISKNINITIKVIMTRKSNTKLTIKILNIYRMILFQSHQLLSLHLLIVETPLVILFHKKYNYLKFALKKLINS
jgi:hypothetical protein